MSRTDPYSNTVTMRSLSPAARTNGTVNGVTVDRAGEGNNLGKMFRGTTVLVGTGTITDGTHTIEVQDSDDGATWAPVADAFLQGTEPAIVAADDDKVFELGYTGLKRYVRVSVTTAGATTGGIFGAYVALSDPRVAPVAHP